MNQCVDYSYSFVYDVGKFHYEDIESINVLCLLYIVLGYQPTPDMEVYFL